jgi:UDP:flavonoid glycosyltransferase YjiC (YdhE family)
MSKVLFFTWSGGGNQPPAIGLAQQLRRAGHDTLFAGYPDQADRLEGLELGFVPLTRSATGEPFDPADLMGWLVRRVWACPDQVAEASEIVDRYQPDLVVVDCLMSAALATVEALGVATAALVHSTPGALAPPGGPLDAMVIADLNRIRSGLGLSAVDTLWQAWGHHSVLNASVPELDPLGAATFDRATWIGPVFEDVSTSGWLPDDGDDRPLVLVSFSSGVAWDQTSRIQRTIDGLADADVRVVVTSGAVDPRLLDLPTRSTTVVPYLPHGTILPKASAVVTHAGHGTLTAALAHGLPIVAIPNNAADQPALAEEAERLGVGIRLADDAASPAAIAAAVRTVLEA